MPELPDVEVFKQYLDATSLHKKIDKLEFGDDILFDADQEVLEKKLQGKELSKTHRIGKHLLVQVKNDDWLSLHFGMTGKLEYYQRNGEEPEYQGFVIRFKNGYNLAFICPRKFGRIGWVENVEEFEEEKELGPDALRLEKQEFVEILESKRGMIKTALMDQSSLCGIGNIYSDEILYQCRIHPKKDLSKLEPNDLEEMYDKMQEIFRISIEHGAKPSELPAHFIIPRREEGADCPEQNGKIERIEVSGRGCYYCPEVQTK